MPFKNADCSLFVVVVGFIYQGVHKSFSTDTEFYYSFIRYQVLNSTPT
jgi:hypothetical protein